MVDGHIQVVAKARIKELMQERAGLRVEQEDLTTRLEAVIKELIQLFQLLGMTKATNELGLWVYNPPGTSYSLDQEQLKFELLAAGLTADEIKKAFDVATKKGHKKPSLTYRPVATGAD